MQDTPHHVYVTGAGFTRAFVPAAPLLVDDFGNDRLVKKVAGLPKASELLEAERNQHHDGYIDIERLMTRLDDLMPYDYADATADEFSFLLTELKRALFDRLTRARSAELKAEGIRTFAAHCAATDATCITFNYDDFLDEALSATVAWNPYWGYGFFCRSVSDAVSMPAGNRRDSQLLLLKLHGSINWWPRLGSARPYALDAVMHYQEWEGVAHRRHPPELVSRHLEPEPVIVPPVLSKSALVTQPILRLVWTLAFNALARAEAVTFVGYSFPPTDTAARILFTEALRDLPVTNITVVGLEPTDQGQRALKSRYRGFLGDIPDHAFFLEGALTWAGTLKPG